MKLSELPSGSTVTFAAADYIKHDDGRWYNPWQPAMTTELLQDAIDKEDGSVKIIQIPWVYLVQAIIMLQDEYGHTDAEGEPITFESVFKDIAGEADRIIKDKD